MKFVVFRQTNNWVTIHPNICFVPIWWWYRASRSDSPIKGVTAPNLWTAKWHEWKSSSFLQSTHTNANRKDSRSEQCGRYIVATPHAMRCGSAPQKQQKSKGKYDVARNKLKSRRELLQFLRTIVCGVASGKTLVGSGDFPSFSVHRLWFLPFSHTAITCDCVRAA